MILVAGLALAGLAGIAAAFYFSMRPGGSRARTARTGRAEMDLGAARRRGTSSPPSRRPDRSAGPARAASAARSAGSSRSPGLVGSGNGPAVNRTGPSTVIDFTGPQQALTDAEPPATGRRARRGDHREVAADEPGPGRRAAARRSEEADTDDPGQGSRSRRRTVWRKGSDVDEELWPVAAFGGVSDEQFWDDMAADKPLATTARTAHPADTARPHPPRRGPLPDIRPGDDGGRRAAPEGPRTNPQPRLAPDDRTAVQPAVTAAAQPVSATQPVSVTRPVSATQPVSAARPVSATQPVSVTRPVSAAPAADEDPLTSPAYSLRPKGRVDGRSYPAPGRTRDLGRDQYERPSHGGNGPGRPDPLRPGDAYGSTGSYPAPGYPDPQRPYGGAPQPMSTPPYGERYGYGNPAGSRGPADQGAPAGPAGQPGPVSDPRLTNGGWNPGRAGGPGADGNRGSRPAHPPVNGHRGPYDPQGYGRRLSLPG
jgi:hypothetical protein